jgi:hypothetical protein
METLFALGQLVATPGAIHAAHEAGDNLLLYICRHAAGDWGDLSAADVKANAEALPCGSRILSAYVLSTGVKIWIITEASDDLGNREATTILLPSEY